MLDATCLFKREDCGGSRWNFIVGCPNALAASNACFVTDRWFTSALFSMLLRFNIDGWSADIALPGGLSASPACLLDGHSGLVLLVGCCGLSRMTGRCKGMSSGLYLLMWYLLFGMRSLGLLLMILGLSGVKNAEAGLFRAHCRAGGPTEAGSSAFLSEEVCYAFVVGVWEVELLAAVVLAECMGSATVMRWMFVLLSTFAFILSCSGSPLSLASFVCC